MHQAIKRTVIKGKPVYIFEKHNHALSAWADIKNRLGEAPRVLSLDHHTDTKLAFENRANLIGAGENLSPAERKSMVEAERSRLVAFYSGEWERADAASNVIKYDEQIYTAVALGVVSFVHSLALSCNGSSSDWDLARREDPNPLLEGWNVDENHLAEMNDLREKYQRWQIRNIKPSTLFFSTAIRERVLCQVKSFHATEEHEYRKVYDAVLEDEFLTTALDRFDLMWNCGVGRAVVRPYVLDIDLDYFHTAKSLRPDKIAVFYGLIRNCSAITIARETDCVAELRLPGETITSDTLQESLLGHIHLAL